jgi:hypothetical protein
MTEKRLSVAQQRQKDQAEESTKNLAAVKEKYGREGEKTLVFKEIRKHETNNYFYAVFENGPFEGELKLDIHNLSKRISLRKRSKGIGHNHSTTVEEKALKELLTISNPEVS